MRQEQRNKQIICKAMRFDEFQYGKMVMDAGFEWLHFMFNDDAFIVDEASRLGLFWNWWKNQWEIREAEYLRYVPLERIDEPLTGDELYMALDLWIEKHNPYLLKIMPNRWLMKELHAILDKQMDVQFGILNTEQNA